VQCSVISHHITSLRKRSGRESFARSSLGDGGTKTFRKAFAMPPCLVLAGIFIYCGAIPFDNKKNKTCFVLPNLFFPKRVSKMQNAPPYTNNSISNLSTLSTVIPALPPAPEKKLRKFPSLLSFPTLLPFASLHLHGGHELFYLVCDLDF